MSNFNDSPNDTSDEIDLQRKSSYTNANGEEDQQTRPSTHRRPQVRENANGEEDQQTRPSTQRSPQVRENAYGEEDQQTPSTQSSQQVRDWSAGSGDISSRRVENNNVSSLAGFRVFNSTEGPWYYRTSDRAKVEARICAGILGTGPLTFEMMITEKWAKAVYSLAHRAVSRAGFAQYLATASVGTITDPLFPGPAHKPATGSLLKIEQLPNLFLDADSLAYKRPALQEYAKTYQRAQLFEPGILEKIQRDLLDEKLKYFGTEDINVVIIGKEAEDSGFRDNVRNAFARLRPEYKSIRGRVMSEGTLLQPWEINVDGFIGAARTKNEARMIALVKRYLDPSFSGYSPLAGSSPLADDALPRLTRNELPSISSVITRMIN